MSLVAQSKSLLVDVLSLSFIPAPVKYIAVGILLVNARSLPFVWHIKVFYPLIKYKLWLLLKGPIRHVKDLKLSGKSPFDDVLSTSHFWAGPDDCDFNGHLSNSCYAKHLDFLRMKASQEWWTPFFMAGGWIGLGTASYSFLTEVPALAMCEVEGRMLGLDDKWLHLEATYLTSGGKKGAKGVRDDGKTVRCAGITSICFKIGRLTIPPAIALSWCTYGNPRNLARFVSLYGSGSPKDIKKCQEWLKEGWKTENNESEGEVLREFEEIGKVKGKVAKEGVEGMRSYLN